MKKFFMFAAMASVAFASCVKNEPAFSVVEEDAIVFNSPVMGVPTKGVEMTGTTYTGEGFTVYGWYHTVPFAELGTPPTTATAYMKGVEAEYHAGDYGDDGTDTYRPQTDYYWPKNGKLSFVAYSPSIKYLPEDVKLTPTCDNAKQMSLVFSASLNPMNQVDLMYSEWAVDRTSSEGNKGGFGGVDIVFNHALSVIYVNIKAENAAAAGAIKLKSVKLCNVYTHGTINLTPDNVHTAKWTVSGTENDYTLFAAEDDATTKLITEVGEEYANYIVIPQDLYEYSEIEIVWYLRHGTEWLEQKSIVELMDGSTTAWERNKRYFYTITMGVDAIYFAPSVTEWVDPDVKEGITSK